MPTLEDIIASIYGHMQRKPTSAHTVVSTYSDVSDRIVFTETVSTAVTPLCVAYWDDTNELFNPSVHAAYNDFFYCEQ